MSGTRLLPLLALVAACGKDAGGGDPADTAACARLETGPFQTLVAASSPDANPPGVDSGNAYRIGNDGFVFYGAASAGDYGIYLDAPVDVAVTDAAGDPIAPSETADGVDACPEVRRRIVVPLAVGPSYLELSGVGADPVTVTVELVAGALDAGP